MHGVDGPNRAAQLLQRSQARRKPGPGPYVLGLRRSDPDGWGSGHPFDVPAVRDLEGLRLDSPITLLAGENGVGKSSVVELLAEAMGFAAQGGELDRPGDPSAPRPVLGGTLVPVLSGTRPHGGYFLRAESFFGVAAFIGSGHELAPDLSLYGDVGLHEQSHGESFLALAANRFGPGGLYVLDEPEAALSVSGQLALLAILTRAAAGGAQVVVATHSPVLLALPGARIYELDEDGAAACPYDALDAVRLTRAFLADPARFVDAALEG